MKRDRALIPLSHDHHHALAAARRLGRAADSGTASAEAADFTRFFAEESVRHFREEEERLFPLVVDSEEARPLVTRALLEHQRLHALARRLANGDIAPMAEPSICSKRTCASRSASSSRWWSACSGIGW